MITAKTKGADVFARRLKALSDPASYRRIGDALDQGAAEIRDLAVRLAPEDDGDLRASIRVEPGKHELQRRVKAGDEKAFYARWVEHGTGEPAPTTPQPFFWPAYRAQKKRVKARIARAARAAVKAAARK